MKSKKYSCPSYLKNSFLIILFCGITTASVAQKPLRLAVAGLNHDHIHGILNQYHKGLVNLVGISEPSIALQQKYKKLYSIPDSLFFTDLKKMVTFKSPTLYWGTTR